MNQPPVNLEKDAPRLEAPTPPPPVSADKGYTIQVASVQDAAAADQLLKELMAQGYAAYAVRSEENGAVWYRLRVGYYGRLDAAQKVMQQLRAKQYNPILVSL